MPGTEQEKTEPARRAGALNALFSHAQLRPLLQKNGNSSRPVVLTLSVFNYIDMPVAC
jgi:hypothetical protein